MKKNKLFILLTLMSGITFSSITPVDALPKSMQNMLDKAHAVLQAAHKKVADFSRAAAQEARELGDVVSAKAHDASVAFHDKAGKAVASAKDKYKKFHDRNKTPTAEPEEPSADAGSDQ